MKIRVDYSKKFLKDLGKAPKKVKIAFRNRLELLLADKYYPLLNNHPLKGDYAQYRSINITGDWRVIFRELEEGEIIFFDRLGTHGKLYN